MDVNIFQLFMLTPARPQSKTLSTKDKREYKIDRNSVFDCHLSPVGRQMAIENTVSIDFRSLLLESIGVFDCCLPGVILTGSVPLSKSFERSAIFTKSEANGA